MRYCVSDKPDYESNDLPYAYINRFIETLLRGDSDRLELDTTALGIHNPSSFYNSAFQAAKRKGCRAHKNGAIITLERVARG
jgi:hypothetical protein